MTKIFVGNLPHSVTDPEIRSLFSSYGRVSSVQIKTDMATNKPRGFAFVTMPSMEDAEEAIVRLAQSSLNGRPLTINEAIARTDRAQQDDSTNSARNDALAMFKALEDE